jgi:hypothetical protein
MWYEKSEKYNERIEICKGCEHFTSVGTCGTPFIGNKVTYNGEELHTCGCKISIKARFNSEFCPLGKWSSGIISKEDACELKEFILSLDASFITHEQKVKLFGYKSKLSGRNEPITNCPPCVRELIEGMKKQIRNLECGC